MTSLYTLSCQTNTPIESDPKVYSLATEKEFAAIESSDYRQRKNSIVEIRKEGLNLENQNNEPKNEPKNERENSPQKRPVENTVPNVSRLGPKKQERLQEINQNLAFFCMKKRKEPAFSDEDKCQNFTNRIFKECYKLHPSLNPKMLTCVVDRLKKKR
jgi:hypothetical protein